jgi:DNA-binding beta-propeller fold protein YncE
MPIAKFATIITTTVAATIGVAACSTSTPGAGPSTTAGKPAAGEGGGCHVNPATAPMPTVEPYEPVPAAERVSVALSGITSGIVTPGGAPTEVDVTLCNDSTVDYPKMGLVVVLQRCTCAPGLGITKGTVERFDPATNSWTKMEHPAMGTGMDYVGAYPDVVALPKGKALTYRYRIAVDASATDGKGGVSATAVDADGKPIQIGKADLPFTVSTGPTTPSSGPSSRQTVLPFIGLTYPDSIAVDAAGNVYVADTRGNRVVEVAAGSQAQTVPPFTGLSSPGGVAVDAAGNVYVSDSRSNRVLKLAAGSNNQTVLPITDLNNPWHLAVDTAGNVYVTNNNKQVVKLAAGSNAQTVLPFTGLGSPGSVAVDAAGDVYVADSPGNQVLRLAAGSNAQTVLRIAGVDHPDRIAVDAAGDVYVIDANNRQVVKLASGSNEQTVLPFTGLNHPKDVAVDAAGNVYVLDNSGFGRVVKLAAS